MTERGAKEIINLGKLLRETSQTRGPVRINSDRQHGSYDPFGAKEIINRRDTATINKPNMHTSFFKRERQYDPFGAKA